VLLVGILGIAGLAYVFFHPSPAPVGQATTPVPSADGTGATAAPSGASTAPKGDLAGTWNVDPSVGSFDYGANDFSGSFVGYRIDEELASIGANTAVGRTPQVDGSLVIDGTSLTSVDITSDLSTLQSDDSRRDGQVRRLSLGTAMFKLTSPLDLGTLPGEGGTVNATATGDLTIHGVTKSVQIPVQAKLAGGIVTVIGSVGIVFADFGVVAPTSPIALSVEDHGIIEFQLHFRHA
jgi:polyisoprenoid-binding protein YceI